MGEFLVWLCNLATALAFASACFGVLYFIHLLLTL